MDAYPDVRDQSACFVNGRVFIRVCSCPSEGEVVWKLLLWYARSCEDRGIVAAMSWLLLEDLYGSYTTRRTVVRSKLLYPAMDDPEGTVNWKLSKRPIKFHYSISWQPTARVRKFRPLIIGVFFDYRRWQDRQCSNNVILRRVRVTIVAWKSNEYYILWACVCSPGYPACKAHAPYCCLWLVWLYHISTHGLTNGTIFEKKKVIEYKIYVLILLKYNQLIAPICDSKILFTH